MNRTILTISALDASCSTGVAADLKTFQTFRAYGACAATAVLARNTAGTQAVHPVPMEILGQQVEAIATDMQVHGVKVGLLPGTLHVQVVASLLEAFQLSRFVVLDPVLWVAGGAPLLDESGVKALQEKLVPLAYALVVNPAEAAALSGLPVRDANEAKEAARVLVGLGAKNVVVTGGDLEGPRALDVWYDGNLHHVFDAPRVASRNTLGLGDTFSAILAALAVKGMGMGESIEKAKQYLAKAMQHPFLIGRGAGPLNHTIPM